MYALNEKKLKGKIVENGMTLEGIAMAINVDRATFYRRLKNSKLLLSDVQKICKVLDLTTEEVLDIFFSK